MGLFLRASLAPATRGAIAFALVLALSIFTHLTGAFFFFALGLVWAWLVVTHRLEPRLLRWGIVAFPLGGALTVLAYAPLFHTLAHTVRHAGHDTATSAVPQYGNPLWTITEGLRGAFDDLGPEVVIAAVVAVALMVLGAVRGKRPVPLFGAVVLVHIVATLALLRLIGMRIWPRFFLLDIGFVLLLLTLGVREACAIVAQRFAPRQAPLLFGLATAAMLAISLALALRNYTAPKQDLTGAITAANALRRPGERIDAVSFAGDVFIGHYHAPWGQIWTSQDYARELARPGPLTLVVGFPERSFATIPELKRDRDAGRIRVVRRLPGTLGDGAVVILQR